MMWRQERKGSDLKHLRSADNRLAGEIALGDHHLLGHEHVRRRDLDTEVSASDHDTIAFLKNLIEVVDTLLVLDLDNDLDALAIITKDGSDIDDILTTANEGSEDHVDTVLDTETKIGLVLLAERRKVNGSLGKVDAFARGESTVVENSCADIGSLDCNNKQT